MFISFLDVSIVSFLHLAFIQLVKQSYEEIYLSFLLELLALTCENFP
jgi:hypothetical protein